MKLEFFIPCIPPKSTHQAALRILKRRDGTQFVGKFATSKGKQTQNELMMLFAPHRPLAPMNGPLKLKLVWAYPYRKSESLKHIYPYKPCDTRPDVDNLLKFIMDIMTRLGFYHDDGQVSAISFMKCWNMETGISVMLEELT